MSHPADEGRVTVETGVAFGTGGGRDLKCDVFIPPTGTRNGRGVILVHGGAWVGGDRSQLRGYGILLGRKGYVCAAIEYRLGGEALWPAQIHDVKAAVRWMRANAADLGISPQKIVIQGNSAGGHLALVAAGTAAVAGLEGDGGNAGVSTSVAAVLAIYPPIGIQRRQWVGLPAIFPRGAPGEALRAASPLTYAGPGYPPTLLIHGNADTVVPAEESIEMYLSLHDAGIPVELHLYANQPHGFDADPHLGRQCADLMASFIDRVLA